MTVLWLDVPAQAIKSESGQIAILTVVLGVWFLLLRLVGVVTIVVYI